MQSTRPDEQPQDQKADEQQTDQKRRRRKKMSSERGQKFIPSNPFKKKKKCPEVGNTHEEKKSEKNSSEVVDSPIPIVTPEKNPAEIDETTKKRLNKLDAIKTAISDKEYPVTPEAQETLLADLRKIEGKLTSMIDDQKDIVDEIKALNAKVIEYRSQYAEEQQAKIKEQVQEVMVQNEKEIENLQKQIENLVSDPTEFKRYTPKKKPSYFSFFKCLSCCDNDSDKENKVVSERSPLLNNK